MSEPMPYWVEALIKSNHQLTQALLVQAAANSDLALAINQMLLSEAGDGGLDESPKTYLDGRPR